MRPGKQHDKHRRRWKCFESVGQRTIGDTECRNNEVGLGQSVGIRSCDSDGSMAFGYKAVMLTAPESPVEV